MAVSPNILSMNYSEARNRYSNHRKNKIIAEKDAMHGSIMIIDVNHAKRLNPVKNTINKSSKNKIPDIKVAQKRAKILFVRDYLKIFEKISTKGLARKYENIFRNTKKKPSKQTVKDFAEILNDLVNYGILKKVGSNRGNSTYSKIINPDKY